MATLQAFNYAKSRIEAGEAILAVAQTVDTRRITRKLALFQKAQKAYAEADERVKTATASLTVGLAKVGDSDDDQDLSLDQLAAALAGDGLPRANPFRRLGFAAPSAIKRMEVSAEAKTIHALVAAVQKKKGLSKASLAAALVADRAATLVDSDVAALEPLQKAQAAAITRRDVLALPWDKSFGALKRATRVADDDGARGLFQALFQSTARPAPKSDEAIEKEAERRLARAIARQQKQQAKAEAEEQARAEKERARAAAKEELQAKRANLLAAKKKKDRRARRR